MSIRDRIEDCVVLDSLGRESGAFLAACVAVAAVSRLRFPEDTPSRRKSGKRMDDSEAFQEFLHEECESIFGPGLRIKGSSRFPEPGKESDTSKRRAITEIIYRYIRSELVHSGQISSTIEFTRDDPNVLKTQFLEEEHKFVFSKNWLSRLLRAVIFARELDGQFGDERASGKILVRQLLPFDITAEQLEEYSSEIARTKKDVEHDVEAIFSHHI